MRILTIGGTQFIGRHFVQAALSGGHEVTVFHRGRTGAGLFPAAAHLTGDRDQDLSALAAGTWDATVDFCAYLPGQVTALAAALGGRGGRHMLISSVSAYRTPAPAGFGEDWPLTEPPGPAVREVTNDTYGGLKVACERAALDAYGAAATTIIRPTYVIGPHDHTYRLTWWVERLARGGRVLAPGDPADPIQVIDARDLASWMLALLDGSVAGAFHAASPEPPFGFGPLLEAIAAAVAPAGTQLTWVDSEFLRAAGLDDSTLPLWPGASLDDASLSAASAAAARATGLAPRPLAQSVADIHAHEAVSPTPVPAGTGIDAAREADLLAAWAARDPVAGGR
ncbi:MAG TPA: NAD-dependent epimerase/dehydratase family protein [Streptosporangiaceae bacterium]